MSENHYEPGLLSELDGHDPAADALREVSGLLHGRPPAASAELTAFLAQPDTTTPSLKHEQRRNSLMKVIHLKATRVRRAAAAAGAAVALATVGAAAMAATSYPVDTAVVQADPSDTTSTTTEATESETTEATEATESETAEATETETAEPTETEAEPSEAPEADQSEAPEVTGTANPRAYANHHDGKGADDEHADVRGGGEVDHRAEDQKTAKQGDDASGQEDADEQEQSDDQESADGDAEGQAGSEAGTRSGGDSRKGHH